MSDENKNEIKGLTEVEVNSNSVEHNDDSVDTSLDRPLVVHNTDDASYFENSIEGEMSLTHNEQELDEYVLERHRFKKKNKKSKAPLISVFIIVIVAAVVAGLYFSGTLNGIVGKAPEQTTKKSYTTEAVNPFLGTITVKGTYIFYEGTEVDGIDGLTKEIKYLDAGTKLIVQDENADSNFLNYEVLSLLTEYEINYDITHVVSSGLVSKYEVTDTTAPVADTTVPVDTTTPVADTTVPAVDTTAAPVQ